MSQIQITNEISARLIRLREVTTTNIDFNRASQLSFEDNRNFVALAGYQNAIRVVGRLAIRYRSTLERDISSCEQTITNTRETDEQLSQALFRAGGGATS